MGCSFFACARMFDLSKFIHFDRCMNRLLNIPIVLFIFSLPLSGANSHLLVYSQGDGAVASFSGQKKEVLSKATFLPKKTLISVRPRSGIETISAGYQFRFGSESKFTLEEDAIDLHSGSIFLRSRKISNRIKIQSPGCFLLLEGSGISLISVEKNGGFKVVGVLGKIHCSLTDSVGEMALLPGDLLFALPDKGGFGDKMSVNLETLISSSYLLSGFPNTVSLSKSLNGIATAQSQLIGTKYNAHVGEAKQGKTFEIIPARNSSVVSNSSSLEEDPLTELLGRSPKRIGHVTPFSHKSGKSPSNSTLPVPPPHSISSERPFPSRLLRPQN